MGLLHSLGKLAAERIPAAESIGRVLDNLALSEREKLPLIMCLYLTYKCNAKCSFCSQGDYVFGDEKKRFNMYNADLERHLRMLELIRAEVPNLYLLGGEPTISPSFGEVLKRADELRFENVAVNTNAVIFRPEILEHCDLLVASLHCDDSEKLASIYGITQVKAEGVYENIKRYAKERDPKKTQMVVNCVVTGDNVGDAWDTLDFVTQRLTGLGVQFNLAPAIGDDGRPDPKLVDNLEYQKLVEWVAAHPGLSSASPQYMQAIKTFQPFICTPNLVPGIQPNGDLIVPCPNLPQGHEAVNLLEVGSVSKAIKLGRERWEVNHGILDTQTACANMCHKACYIETAHLADVDSVIALVKDKMRVWNFGTRTQTQYFPASPKLENGQLSANERKERIKEHRERVILEVEAGVCTTHFNMFGCGDLGPCPDDCQYQAWRKKMAKAIANGEF